MARKMKEKFDKYWGNIDKVNMMLLVAVVLDPRFKLKYVKYCYNSIYPSQKAQMRWKLISQILVLGRSRSSEVHFQGTWKKKKNVDSKSEVDKYLEETIEKDTDDFEILGWWKINSSKYRILSQIARDVLAIPVSTVASESAFSTGGRVLDQFRSSLTPKLVECLICTQDWLRASLIPIDVEESLDELQELESVITEDEENVCGVSNASILRSWISLFIFIANPMIEGLRLLDEMVVDLAELVADDMLSRLLCV
ncbi:hypothetical protein Acr_14g0004850 [Actinidia rufa]|uniref:Zinc finger BED domain-containing protein RICESLEEPER 2-like n=1 Tax=Actinidia rufa TaxID=165716 RepID=A0A7J0FRQ2_9ERIC|nr:hypothetical protein Acr_14g0004850 [Actinidia rufa]